MKASFTQIKASACYHPMATSATFPFQMSSQGSVLPPVAQMPPHVGDKGYLTNAFSKKELINSPLSLVKNNTRVILNKNDLEQLMLIASTCIKDLDKSTVML